MIINKFVRDIFTEDVDGKTFCYVRALSILAGLVLIGLAVFKAYVDPLHFSLAEAGQSMMEYFVGIGAAIWGKEKSGA